MGEDKALMPFLGIPMVQRLRDRFLNLGDEMLVITNQPEGYHFLGLPLYQDVVPGRGALGGLLTALEISSHEYVGLIAADMPFASPALLSFLKEELEGSGADAVLPCSSFGPEPLHAIYRRAACLPLVRQAIADDLWRMDAWHAKGRVELIDASKTLAAAGSENTFFNLNTPEDFQAAEEVARELNM